MRSDSPIRGAVFTLDPRTEELLREVAADPSSCLLRVPRREVEEALTRTDYRGLTSTVGLSAAERELLRTARAEVAYWLNVVCFRRLTEDEETRTFTSGVADGDALVSAPSLAQQALHVRGLEAELARHEPEFDSECAAALDAIKPAVAGGLRVPVAVLANTALRLAPTFSSRLYAVQSRLSGNASQFAVRIADALACTSVSRTEQAYARGVLGTAHWLRGDIQRALDAYAVAATSMPSMPEFGLRALAMAFHTRDVATAKFWVDFCEDAPVNLNSMMAVTGPLLMSSERDWSSARLFARQHRSVAKSHTQELFDAFALH